MNQVCRAKADQLVTFWKTWQHHPPRVFNDAEISEADLSRYSLILLGGAEANLVARKFAERKLGGVLPLEFPAEAGTVKIGERVFQGTDVRVQAIGPNPLNPQRYVLVVAGTSATALTSWFPASLRNAEFDFLVEEGAALPRPTPVPGQLMAPPQRWIARGWFDPRWQIDDATVLQAAAR